MAFALGDIIIDRVQYGYAEDFSGTPLYTLTQLQDATINISAESTDAVDNTGAIVKRFWKAKTGEFTANNAMINLNIIAAGAGEGSATLAETKAFDMPRIITATQDGTGAVTVKLGESADVKEESIKVNSDFIRGIDYSSYTPFSLLRSKRNMEKFDVGPNELNLKPRPYNTHEVVRIVNPKQRDLYIKHRVYPIDMYPSVNEEGKDIIVYIFLKEETKDLFQKWIDHTLE